MDYAIQKYHLWKDLVQLKKQLAKMKSEHVGFRPTEYITMIALSRQIDRQMVIQFFETVCRIVSNDIGDTPLQIGDKTVFHFLSSFIGYYFPKETNYVDPVLVRQTKMMIKCWNDMVYSDTLPTLKSVRCFVYTFQLFETLYKTWMEAEKICQIEDLSQQFWVTCGNIHLQIKDGHHTLEGLRNVKQHQKEIDGKNVDTLIEECQKTLQDWETQYETGFQELKDKFRNKAKEINGECGVKYFDSLVPIFIDPSFQEHVRSAVHQAFWDQVEADADQKNYTRLVDMLRELKIYMMACIPHRVDIHQEIDDNIDVDYWHQLVEHDAFYRDDVPKLGAYVLRKITKWIAPNKLEDVETARTLINENHKLMTQGKLTFGKYIVSLLRASFELLEDILRDSYAFKSTQEYKMLRERINEAMASR